MLRLSRTSTGSGSNSSRTRCAWRLRSFRALWDSWRGVDFFGNLGAFFFMAGTSVCFCSDSKIYKYSNFEGRERAVVGFR